MKFKWPDLSEFIGKCWAAKLSLKPTFNEIVEELLQTENFLKQTLSISHWEKKQKFLKK